MGQQQLLVHPSMMSATDIDLPFGVYQGRQRIEIKFASSDWYVFAAGKHPICGMSESREQQ